MANEEQLSILKQGVEVWNKWRAKIKKQAEDNLIDLKYVLTATINEEIIPYSIDLREADLSGFVLDVRTNLRGANFLGVDFRNANLHWTDLEGANLAIADLRSADLSDANLAGADLRQANLSEANLERANLPRADLSEANLTGASLSGAELSGANLSRANLSNADLSKANLRQATVWKANLSETNLWKASFNGANLSEVKLWRANLWGADLSEADLSGANLRVADLGHANLRYANLTATDLGRTILVGTKIDKVKVSGSKIYGINVWDLEGEFAEQKDLIITPPDAPIITVDNIKVAQFIYLILNNEEVRDVINTLTSKSVLILGRFAIPERKTILDALRNKLREYDLLPIVFDFDRPTDKDFTETIKTLAGLSYFVIADVTNPKSSPLELQATVPDYQIPFVPIIQEGESPFAMMVDLQKKYNWVLDTLSYNSIDTLIKALKPAIIDPAIQMHNELRLIKAREPKIRSANDFIEDKGLE